MAIWMSNGSTGQYYQTNGTVTTSSAVYSPRRLPNGPASFQYLSLPDGKGMLLLVIGMEIVATISKMDQPVAGYYLSWRGGVPLYEYSLESLLETLSSLFDSAGVAYQAQSYGGGGGGGSITIQAPRSADAQTISDELRRLVGY